MTLALAGSESAAALLKVWYHAGDNDHERIVTLKLIDAWNVAHADMTAELAFLAGKSCNEQVQAAAISGGLTDLLDLDGQNYKRLHLPRRNDPDRASHRGQLSRQPLRPRQASIPMSAGGAASKKRRALSRPSLTRWTG